jgi:hypothetical protein
MKYCSSCGVEVDRDVAFCSACGAEQGGKDSQSEPVSEQRSAFLVVLCVITITGSVMGMFRGWFYELVAISFAEDDEYWRGWAYALLHLGTLVGAIAMLNRKAMGLLVYTASQSVYILMVFYVASEHRDLRGMMIASVFLVPSIAFLVMYWLPVNRGVLSRPPEKRSRRRT